MAVDFGQSILASSIALGGLLVIMAVVYFIWSRIGLKKKQKYFKELHVELAPGQEDEKSMGIDYPTLDRMLIAHFEHGVSENGLVEAGFNRADAERVLAKVRSQAFKRALEPPYPDVKFYE